MSKLTLSFISEEDQSLRQLLKQYLSRRTLTAVKHQGGQLLVDGQAVTVTYFMKKGQQVDVVFPEEQVSPYLIPYHQPLDILFEDQYYLIVNKPAGQPTLPTKEGQHESLVEQVLAYFLQNKLSSTPHVVTRLDRYTSGIVIFAKYQYTHYLITQQAINKFYLALVDSGLEINEGQLTGYMSIQSGSIIKRIISDEGQYSKTSFKVQYQDEKYALVKLQLHTGRTHQIRVHLSHFGYPIVGDSLYGGDTTKYSHQALHCYAVKFIHPITHQLIEINLLPDNDFQQLIHFNQWQQIIKDTELIQSTTEIKLTNNLLCQLDSREF